MRLVVDNSGLTKLRALDRTEKHAAPRLIKVADNGPKMRIDVGLRLVPREVIRLTGSDYKLLEAKGRGLLDRLPPELRKMVAYGDSPNPPVVEPLRTDYELSYSPLVSEMFMLVRHGENRPWGNARQLRTEMLRLERELGELREKIAKFVSNAKVYFRLVTCESEKLPEWFVEWRAKQRNVSLVLTPDLRDIFGKRV